MATLVVDDLITHLTCDSSLGTAVNPVPTLHEKLIMLALAYCPAGGSIELDEPTVYGTVRVKVTKPAE